MADRIITLKDDDNNPTYPIAGGMMADSVTTAMLKDDSVTTAKIADGAVTSQNIDWTTLQQGSVSTSSLPSLKITYLIINDTCFVQMRSTGTDSGVTVSNGGLVSLGCNIPVASSNENILVPAITTTASSFTDDIIILVRPSDGLIRLFNKGSSSLTVTRVGASFSYKIS